MIIKILSKSTAEKIAAGEVIENPASVVKELIENALDARATKIEVTIEGGGKELVSVTDNGCGINKQEIPIAFKRFATSKIDNLEDLFSLKSLGFRGEALPSIAAVSKIDLTSKPEAVLSGHRIELAGGEVVNFEEVGAPSGTRVEVRELFYNTPGRLKFLRSSAAESAKISFLLTEMALAWPSVSFTLQSGTRRLLGTTGDDNLYHTIGAIYGSETAEAMIALKKKDKENGCSIEGYISAPYLTRSSRRWITIVVNGRVIKNPLIVNALERGYEDLLPGHRHPLAVLRIEIAPDRLDVNVHPAKTEIRFAESESIKGLVFRSVKAALREKVILPGWPGQVEETTDYRLSVKKKESEPRPTQLLFEHPGLDYSQGRKEEGQRPTSPETFQVNGENPLRENGESDEMRLIGQYLQSYLVVQKGEDLMLIDQHAAHEKAIYHQLKEAKSRLDLRKYSCQLTMPLTVELPVSWRERMPKLLPMLEEAGFNLQSLGGDSYAIRALPFTIDDSIKSDYIYRILEEMIYIDGESDEDYRDKIMATVACHRAIKAKQLLTREEMEQLLRLWSPVAGAQNCPHGRPTVISFKRRELEKSFHRHGG
jgi:DNA mismatch repair protein MutL